MTYHGQVGQRRREFATEAAEVEDVERILDPRLSTEGGIISRLTGVGQHVRPCDL